MTGNLVTNIREGLSGTTVDQQAALEKLGELIEQGDERACECLDDLISCGSDGSHYTRLLAWDCIEQAADTWPATLGENDEEITAGVASDHQQIQSHAVATLRSIVTTTEQPLDVNTYSFRRGLSVGESSASFRREALQVLGFVPDPASVDLLLEYQDIEIDSIQPVIEQSLEQIRPSALAMIHQSEDPAVCDPAGSLRRLSTVSPDLLLPEINKIAVALGKAATPDEISEALVNTLRYSRRPLPKIFIYVFHVLADPEADPETQSQALRVIEEFLNGHPQTGTALLAQRLDGTERVQTPPGSPKEPMPRTSKLAAALGHPVLEDCAICGLVAIVRDSPDLSEAVFTSVAEQATESPQSAVKALQALQDALQPAPDIGTGVQPAIHILLEQDADRQVRSTCIRLLTPLVAEPSAELISGLFSELDRGDIATGGDADRELLIGLEVLARADRGTVECHLQDLISWLQSPEPEIRVTALSTIQQIAGRFPAKAAECTEAVVGCLDDDPEVQVAACEALAALQLFPVPSELKGLKHTASTSPARKAAYRAVKALHERHSYPTSEDLLDGGSAASLLDDSGVFRYYDRSTNEWAPLTPADAGRNHLEQVSEWVGSGSSGLIALPAYQPWKLMPIIIEAVLRRIESEPTVAVFSPIWRNRWGTKRDLKEEYMRYGVSPAGSPYQVTPIHHLVPIARVTNDGEVICEDAAQLGGCVPIVKHLSDLSAVESPDAIVLNFTARQKQEHRALIGDLRDRHPGTSILVVYTPFTERRRQYAPSYNPIDPGKFDLPATLTELPAEATQASLRACETWAAPDITQGLAEQLRSAPSASLSAAGAVTPPASPSAAMVLQGGCSIGGSPPRVHIEPVGRQEINSALDSVYTHSKSLQGGDADALSNRIFYTRLLLERLPLPPRQHDEWIRQSRLSGNHGVPDRVERRVEDLTHQVSGTDVPGAAGATEQSILELQDIIEELNHESPILKRLLEYVEVAAETDARLILFCHKQTWAEMVQDALTEKLTISDSDLESWGVAVAGPREVRTLSGYDLMVIPGPLRPNMRAYYCHPGVEAIEVLTYGSRWTSSIRSAVKDAVSDLGTYLLDDAAELPAVKISEGEAAPSIDTVSPEGQVANDKIPPNHQRLINAFHTATRDEASAGGRGRGEQRHFRFETEEGITLSMVESDQILRERTQSSGEGERYHWIDAGSLMPGDRVVQFDDRAEQHLWEAHIRELWAEQGGDESVEKIATGLRLWHRTVQQIIDEARAGMEGAVDDRTLQGALADDVIDAGSTLSKGAIKDWFIGVMGANRPMDLVREPSLRIGPQQQADIEYTGRAFERDQLIEYSEYIDAALTAFRTTIRQEGTEFQSKLQKGVASDGENSIKEAARWLTISDVHRVDARGEAEDSDEEPDRSRKPVTDGRSG